MTEQDKDKKATDVPKSEPDTTSAIDALKKERDEYLNGWKRAKADLINYKKEEDRRFAEMAAFSNVSLIKELLAGMDSFDLALSGNLDEQAKKGIAMIRSQFEEILRRQGVTRIKVCPGDPLDPRLHEALGEIELDPNDPKSAAFVGKIAEELVAGYVMGERVVRAAKVRVGKSANNE